MEPKKHNNDNNYSQHIEESIASAEEERKQALEEQKSLADQELEEISGGCYPDPTPIIDGGCMYPNPFPTNFPWLH